MTKPTVDKLYVNLSASQVRKRLKGHGFGVRRVEAADRKQSVIIHTATGEHLRELESLFADVLRSTFGEDR
jgi:hypothetical protein